jgi:cytochrome c-type biogenesis protein CcmE
MKPRVIIGVVAIVGFTSLLMINLGQSIESYVDFEEAENRTGNRVHVVGNFVPDMPHGYNTQTRMFTFHMQDNNGNVRRVSYNKPKPANFDDAESLVVIGKLRNGIFYSDDMLIKCPSKYNDASEFEMTATQ